MLSLSKHGVEFFNRLSWGPSRNVERAGRRPRASAPVARRRAGRTDPHPLVDLPVVSAATCSRRALAPRLIAVASRRKVRRVFGSRQTCKTPLRRDLQTRQHTRVVNLPGAADQRHYEAGQPRHITSAAEQPRPRARSGPSPGAGAGRAVPLAWSSHRDRREREAVCGQRPGDVAYLPGMDRDALRAYAHRVWAEVERLGHAYWAELYRRRGPAIGFRTAAALAEYVRRARPDWPSPAQRQQDLDHHVALKRRIDRAARAFAPG